MASGGTVTLNTNGAFTYQAASGLAEGQTLVDTFTYTITDSTGRVGAATATVNVTGVNDPAVITTAQSSAQTSGQVVEFADGSSNEISNAEHSATGTLAFTDVDLIDTHTVSVTPQGTGYLGNLTTTLTDSTGTGSGSLAWRFGVFSDDVNHLTDGQILTQTYVVAISDAGGSDSRIVTVTIVGTNDAPLIGGTSTGSVTEDAIAAPSLLATNGALTITDDDTGEAVFIAQSGTAGSNGHGTFTLLANGSWSYQADNTQTAIQQLGAADSLTDSFTAVSADGSNSQLVTVTIQGANDIPTIVSSATSITQTLAMEGALSGTTYTESGFVFSLQNVSTSPPLVLGNFDGDADQELQLGSSTVGQAYTLSRVDGGAFDLDGLTIAANGGSILTVRGSNGDQSSHGGTGALNFPTTFNGVTSVDLFGVLSIDDVVVTFSPSATTGAVTELVDGVTGENTAVLSATGSLAFNETDLSDSHTASFTAQGTGYIGTFAAVVGDAATGDGAGRVDWTFSVNDAALDYLADGQILTQSYDVVVNDGTSNSSTETVTVTITGENDAPVISTIANTTDNFSGLPAFSTLPVNFAGFNWANANRWFTFSGVELRTQDNAPPDLQMDRGGELFIFNSIDVRVNGNTYTAKLEGFRDGALVAQETFTVTTGYAPAAFSTEILVDTVRITEFRGPQPSNVLKNDGVDVFVDNFSYGLLTPVGAGAGPVTGAVSELPDGDPGENTSNLTANGSIVFTDSETGDNHTVNFTPQAGGYLGTFTPVLADPSSGDGLGRIDWTFTVNDAALDSLAAGQAVTQLYDIAVEDGTAAPVVRTVEITINGANDAPDVSAVTNPAPVPEGDVGVLSNVSFDLATLFTATDVDTGETPAIDTGSIVITANAGSATTIISPFVIFPANPTTVVVDTANYDFLNSGQDAIVDVTFDVVSGSDRVTRTATITINGVTDNAISENFEGGATGWIELAPDRTHYEDNKTDATETGGFTEFLGRFSGSGGAEAIQKTYTLNGSQDSITIGFDFYEINSWDGGFGEAFKVFADTTEILSDNHQMNGGPAAFDHATATTAPGDLGFPNQFGAPNFDQIWRYEFTIETGASIFLLGFGAILDPNVLDDESFGIDNLTIVENADLLSGTAGADILRDADGAHDIIWANAGDDTIILEAQVDTSNTFNPNFTGIDGGTGQDILQLGDAGTLDLTAINNANLTSIETIDLNSTTTNTLTVNLQDVVDISETVNTDLDSALATLSPAAGYSSVNNLLISGNGSDTVNLVDDPSGGGWVDIGSNVTIGGQAYDVINYTRADGSVAATVAIDTDVARTGLNSAPTLAALEAAAGTGATLGGTGSDFARINSANFTINLGLTVTFWAQDPGRSGTEIYLSYDAPGAGDFEIFGNSFGDLNVRAQNSGTLANVAAPTLTDGDWHHVAVVYAGLTGVTQFYIDGVLVGSDSTAAGAFTSGGTLLIGENSLPAAYDGSIGDIGIWNGQLTAAQIATIASGTVNPSDSQLEIFLQYNASSGQFEDQAGSNDATSFGNISVAAGPDLTTNTFYENQINEHETPFVSNTTVGDAEGNFNGGTLEVSGLNPLDYVSVENQGAGATQIGYASGSITYGGAEIGVVGIGSGQTGNGENLHITLNGTATVTSVEALIQALTYGHGNTADTPSNTSSLNVTLTDSAGSSVSQSIGINVIGQAEDAATITSTNTFFTGTAGADVIIGTASDENFAGNGGADEIRGSGGDDVIAISDASFELLQGGFGNDTLRLDGGLDLDLTGVSNLKIRNIETINLRNADDSNLTLDIFDVFDISGEIHTDLDTALAALKVSNPSLEYSDQSNLVIAGGSTDSVTFVAAAGNGSWQDTGFNVQVGGQQHDVVNYVSSANEVLSTVAIETDVSNNVVA